jgi:hypothetical protein
MLTYLPDDPRPGGKYGFSYQQLREDYLRFVMMNDDDFLGNIVDILHFAAYTCYIKELNTQWVLSDTGIVHELIHLLCEERNRARGDEQPEVSTTSLEKIRDLFNHQCCLA